LTIRNAGPRCSLPVRPLVSIVWKGSALSIEQVVGTGYGGSGAPLRTLRPGERAFVVLRWSNWCKRQPARSFRAAVRLLVPGQLGRLFAIPGTLTPPRCDDRTRPSTLRVSRFLPPPR
jgi:hypothetical protein